LGFEHLWGFGGGGDVDDSQVEGGESCPRGYRCGQFRGAAANCCHSRGAGFEARGVRFLRKDQSQGIMKNRSPLQCEDIDDGGWDDDVWGSGLMMMMMMAVACKVSR
jgi:hypothetical protein